MVKTEAFPTIRMKIDRLLKITNEYQFNDLVKAVYCINLCINNRSVLESCLALNACLIEYEEKGSKRIGTYDEFKGFFGKIYDVMKPGIADDYTVEDFGEVQLRYNDKFYRVIIGTGHNNVYACLNFLPTLARNISREEELCLALEYVSGTIDYFIEENKNDGVVEKRFVLPTEILFYKVQKFFKEEVKKYDILELDSLMMSEGTTIEKSHFVCREDNIYPLYNVSLLIDLYDIWENKIDFKEQISVANEGIIDRIYSLFEMDRSRSCSIFAPAMIFPEQKYDSSQRTYTFIAKASRGVVVALNADEYEEGQLEKEIANIEKYHKKHGMGFGGIYLPLPQKNYVFLTNNVEFYKDVKDFGEYRQWIQLLEEIITEGFDSIKCVFEDNKAISNTGIQIAFMPIEYAVHAGHESFLYEDRIYVYSDAQYYSHKWIIRYVVKDINRIYEDIQEAKNRSTEFNILREILIPLLDRMPDLNELFESKRKKVSLEKKKVGVFSASVEYKWDNNVQNFSPEDYHYHEVRKRIANVCYGNMIKPGIYRGQEANQIIRAMQKAIIEDFEGEVSKYSWSELHYSLLDYHSTLLHDIDINWKRYGSYSGLDEKKDKEVRDRIIDQREKAKHDDRNTLYLIETNLYLHCESETLATIDDINLLLAYANWLVVLNDVADMCHFADNEAYIEITDEYVVDTLADDQDAEALSGLHHRIYSYSGGLKRDHETDFKYLEKVKETFKEDMGFDLTDFLDILSYFSNSFSETIVKKIGNNVFRAPMKELLRDFLEQMNNVITEEDAATLFNYLVVSSQNLKTENGKINFYLPIGKRRTRDTRFELMPLVSINGDIIFSPITMDRLKKDWLNGIMDFILPYEVRMNKTKQLIVEWKKSYEKQIVYDIANSFKKNKFDIIKQNFELMKLNKSHPQWLGDYDVFAVDINNKSIWIVECKVIEKVATFYDMYRQQNRFFNEHKEDEKFQRRIDYLRENADQVIQQLGCTDYIGYKVIPYMCMNKVLVSRYKKVTFPIVSYPELVEIISGATRE